MILRLLSPDDATGASASGTQGDTGEALFEGAPDAGTTTTAAEGTTTTPDAAQTGTTDSTSDGASAVTATGAAPTGLSKDDVQAILAGALEQIGGKPEPQAQPAREYTQEDYERAFNVMKFSPELLAQLRSEDPAVALKAYKTIQDGIIRQAMTMAEYRMQQFVKEIREKDLAPIQTYVTEQQASSFRNDFFKEYPALEPYEQLIDAVAIKLESTIKPGTSRAEVMKTYAAETQKIVDKLTAANGGTGNGAAAAGKGNGGGTPPAKSRMSTLTGGGQNTGGRATGTAAGQKGPPGIEVFD